MSETSLMAKILQPYPKQGIISELHMSSPCSPYLGAIELQFALGTFYKLVVLSLMVLYQLESIHLDDYNLIYSKKKTGVFTNILTAFPLKTPHSPFYNYSIIPQKPHEI